MEISHKAFDPTQYESHLIPLLKELETAVLGGTKPDVLKLIRKYTPKGIPPFSKADIIAAYRLYAGTHGLNKATRKVIDFLKVKPTRTISGVAPLTVLTKPYPCPGKCIFCPSDIRMPKSYLSKEPGAQRAEKNLFDPYLQTYSRLETYRQIGHVYDKAEVIVLGGTWSFYPEPYRIWFIKRIFEALNDFGEGIDKTKEITGSIDVTNIPDTAGTPYNQTVTTLYWDQEHNKKTPETATWDELETEHHRNETAPVRCVGLVLETRPDHISEAEVHMLRRLGCTKTQIGLQSLQDEVLEKNERGHSVAASRRAFRLLRQAGFKIHAHWMPNLYGSTVERDKADFDTLFSDPDFKPDELKVYPCSLIANTPLVAKYESGEWAPYDENELLEVITHVLKTTPEYCRLTRIIRDISGSDILVGNKKTNFRQIAEASVKKEVGVMSDIRAREVKNLKVTWDDLKRSDLEYETSVSTEIFLQYVTSDNRLAGFLRLSLPKNESYLEELGSNAIIREVHVYGQVVGFGKKKTDAPQHSGLGSSLIEAARSRALERGYARLSVISAVGTREYYRKLGFNDGELYQHFALKK